MNTDFLTGALNAAGQQAITGTIMVSFFSVIFLSVAWMAAGFMAGKNRAGH